MTIISTHLSLEDLPSPIANKTGWPWTEQNYFSPKIISDGSQWPRISIVTPSYNQGQFLEETIRSILLQGYPNLEYIVIDGGSTDNSVEIIQKYEPYLAYWVSEPDGGQSNALNKGFKQATGELIGWQNSDDYYSPNAFMYAAQAILLLQDVDIIYGAVRSVDEKSLFVRENHVSEFSLIEMIPWANMFNQSMFFKTKIFQDNHFINESFHHYMDLEFFWRLALAGYKFKLVPEMVGNFRLHKDAKGATQYETGIRESRLIYQTINSDYRISSKVRKKAVSCIHSQCLDCFGKSKISLFHESFQGLVSAGGLMALSPELIIKYFISLTGDKSIDSLRKIYRLLAKKQLE